MIKVSNSKQFVSQLEEVHLNSEESNHSCMYCWHPVVNNKCKSCGTENSLESDPFLNMTEELVLS